MLLTFNQNTSEFDSHPGNYFNVICFRGFDYIYYSMQNCKKCNIEFKPKKGLLNYCSLKCRNGRIWLDADKLKKSKAAKKSEKVKVANRANVYIRKSGTETRIKNSANKKIKYNTSLLNADFKLLKWTRLRNRIRLEQQNKCNRCKLDIWLNEPLPLELEHIDGNHNNTDRLNLEMLCPNCHSLTSTWRGRNIRLAANKISDAELLNSLINLNWNIRKALLHVNMAAKGGNYKRCYNLKEKYIKNTNACDSHW